jgi:hypothetical protein
VVVPAVPLPLRAFAELLRHDGGRQLGRAVLFASVVGFNVVEQRKADLAAISGVSAARIQQIVDTGRQALSTASPVRPDQHVVSQALLRRFCIPTSQGDRLLSYNLQFGDTRLLPTRQVGKLENFVKIDSEETEQLWARTEQELPAAIDAARTRRVLRNPHRRSDQGRDRAPLRSQSGHPGVTSGGRAIATSENSRKKPDRNPAKDQLHEQRSWTRH